MQYLGGRGKIIQIHMRNIKGGLHDFAEVFPDEGDMEFYKIMRILRDTQFSGSICPITCLTIRTTRRPAGIRVRLRLYQGVDTGSERGSIKVSGRSQSLKKYDKLKRNMPQQSNQPHDLLFRCDYAFVRIR